MSSFPFTWYQLCVSPEQTVHIDVFKCQKVLWLAVCHQFASSVWFLLAVLHTAIYLVQLIRTRPRVTSHATTSVRL